MLILAAGSKRITAQFILPPEDLPVILSQEARFQRMKSESPMGVYRARAWGYIAGTIGSLQPCAERTFLMARAELVREATGGLRRMWNWDGV